MTEAENYDHLVHLSNFQIDLSDLETATEILYHLVHNNGDEAHLKWVTEKLVDDADKLSKTFSEHFDADIAKLRPDRREDVQPNV
jgi:hypothetical protein